MSRVETFLASGEIVTPDFPSPFYCRGLARFESFCRLKRVVLFFFFFLICLWFLASFFLLLLLFTRIVSCLGVIWYMFNIWIVF